MGTLGSWVEPPATRIVIHDHRLIKVTQIPETFEYHSTPTSHMYAGDGNTLRSSQRRKTLYIFLLERVITFPPISKINSRNLIYLCAEGQSSQKFHLTSFIPQTYSTATSPSTLRGLHRIKPWRSKVLIFRGWRRPKDVPSGALHPWSLTVAPENGPSQKDSSSPTIIFQGASC